jgi:uncharacterized protein (DUF433 family)
MKQEYKARRWAYNKLVSPEDICNAVGSGLSEIYEIAEVMDLPEDFLQECIAYYRARNELE